MRKAYVVYVDLDDVPGDFHSQESAQNVLNAILRDRIPQYNPMVSLAPEELQPTMDVAIEFDSIQFGEKPFFEQVHEVQALVEKSNAGSFVWDLSQMNRPYYEVSECVDAGSSFVCMGDVLEWVIFPDETARYRLCENHCSHRRGHGGAFGVHANGVDFHAIYGNTHEWVRKLEIDWKLLNGWSHT